MRFTGACAKMLTRFGDQSGAFKESIAVEDHSVTDNEHEVEALV